MLVASLALGSEPAKRPASQPPSRIRLDDHTQPYAPMALPVGWQVERVAPIVPTNPLGEGAGKLFPGSRKIPFAGRLFEKDAEQFYQFHHGPHPDDRYILLRSGKVNSFILGRNVEFKLSEYPWLEWDWMVVTLPPGGDVRVREKDDQAGQMCVSQATNKLLSNTICYLYQEDGPLDTPLKGSKRDRTRVYILRVSKLHPIGRWYHERRNMADDYRRQFNQEPDLPMVMGVGIDSDDTRSSAEAKVKGIYITR